MIQTVFSGQRQSSTKDYVCQSGRMSWWHGNGETDVNYCLTGILNPEMNCTLSFLIGARSSQA